MEILHPMFGMIALSGAIAALLFASRAPIILKSWGKLQHAKHSDALRPNLPPLLRYITDNYNHIFEQPTLFYATCAYIFMSGHSDAGQVSLAWGYVAARCLHSVIQVTVNNVTLRAAIFLIASVCLLAMIVREAMLFL